MSMVSQLDELLSGTFSLSAWSDDAVLHAQHLIGMFSDADWRTLEDIWQRQGSVWQQRLADALPHGVPGRAVPILTAMIEGDDDELGLEAADSLRDFVSQLPLSALSNRVRMRLDALAQRSRLGMLIITDLYKQHEGSLQA